MNVIQQLSENLAEKRNELEVQELCISLLPKTLPHVHQAYISSDYIAISIPASSSRRKPVT